MSAMLWWLVLPGALLIGLCLFAVFGMFVTGVRWEQKREELLAELESVHHMKSQVEVSERIRLMDDMLGKPEALKPKMRATLAVMEQRHKQAWDARVKQIVALKCPVPDEAFEELDRELRERGW